MLTGLGALVAPVRTARRSEGMPLWQAWLVHVAGLLCAAAVVALLNIVAYADGWSFPTFINEAHEQWSDAVRGLDKLTAASLAIATFGWLSFEVWLAIGAVAASAWGARSEPVWASIRRSLGRLWLLTPYAATLILLFGTPVVVLDRLESAWWVRTSGPFTPNYFPSPPPWYVQHGELLVTGWWVVVATVGLVSILRAMNAGAWGPRCVWPAVCRSCGYVLLGVRADQACPECGEPVIDSLDELRQPLVPWEASGRWRGYFQTLRLAVLRPSDLGARFRLHRPVAAHRAFLAITLVVLFLFGPVSVVGTNAIERLAQGSPGPWLPDREVAVVGGVALSSTYIALAMCIILVSASTFGIGARMYTGKNALTGTLQAACYLSPLLIVCAVSTWAVIMALVVFFESDLAERLAQRYDELTLAMSAVGLVIGTFMIAMIAYVRLLGRMTYAMRNSNV